MTTVTLKTLVIPDDFTDSELDRQIRSTLRDGGILTYPLTNIRRSAGGLTFKVESKGTEPAQLLADYASRCLERTFGGCYNVTVSHR